MKFKNYMFRKMITAQSRFGRFIQEEKGEVNIIAIILIIIVVIALVIFFRDSIKAVIDSLFQKITRDANAI